MDSSDATSPPHSKQDEKMSSRGDGDGDGDDLEDIFHQVVQLVRESSSSSSSSSYSSSSANNNDVKLKLYGLYKYITEGKCNIPPPAGVGIFNVVARSKYQAWKAVCTDQNYTSRDEAMMEYIQIFASTRNDDDDEIGEKCKLLLSGLLLNNKYNNNNNNNSNSSNSNQRQQQQESSSSSSDNIMTSSEDNNNNNNNNNLTTTTTLKEESAKLISTKKEGKPSRTFEIHHPNIIKNTTTTCNNKNDNSNFMMWTTILLQQKKWLEILLGYIGIRPLIPRGLLDISFKDLFFALIECCCTCYTNTTITQQRHVLTEIINIWKDATAITTTTPANNNEKENNNNNNNNNNNVEEVCFEIAVGLSVRSIFDVYLSSKTYSMDSEMIVFPPINVPGMMYVAKYHNINIVPVDIGGKNNEWWNWEGILEAITDRTVAIMIVHPFGIVSTSTKQMEQIRKLADKHKLELWEDCSECFMGLGGGNNNNNNCYLGNSLADIRFFSFGSIKTATALGGGIAIFKDQHVGRHIQNLCMELPQRQTNFQFFRRVLLSICLNFIGISPIRVGILQKFCSILGISYDTVVTKAIRSFKMPHHVFDQEKGTKINERDSRIQANFMKQIRKQPSLPLLKLLLRRTRQSTLVAPSLPARLRRCQEMKSLLESAIPDVLFSKPPNFNNTYWVFPISCADRDSVSRKLEQRGYDVVSGASQLCCISKFSNNDSNNKCPRTEELMDSILYLPIASQELLDMVDFVDCLQDAVSTGRREIDNPVSSSNTLPAPSTVVAITFSLFLLQFPFQMTLSPGVIFKLLSSILFLLAFAIVGSIVVLDLLRRLIANFYLDETTAFSQHCDMVDAATSEGIRNFDTSMEHVEKILPEIALLTLPAPSIGDKSTQRKVILTGATGFVGSLLLRDLLFHRDRLSLSGGVIVICRPKATKPALTRIADLLEQPMFSFLTKLDKKSLVRVMEGDVTKPLGGLSEADLNMIINDDSITHVFHTAAAVGFTQSLSDAARSNITSSLNMQALSMRLPNKNSTYVHISTAFVHGGRSGSKDAPLKETLFPLEPFSPGEIYKSMLTTQYYASKAMAELRFPNTYTFSKCVCEHLLLSNKSAATMVIRPNIVGPAIETPFEGWAGKKPSTIVAGAALHLSSQWNVWYLERLSVSCIPVDVLSRFILAKAFDLSFCKTAISNETVTSSDGSFEKISRSSDSSDSASDAEQLETSIAIDGTISLNSQVIFNATWDPSSTAANSFCWLEFSIAYLQLGSVLGYFGRATSYLVLLVSARVMPFLRLGITSYERLHYFVVRLPIEVAMMCLDRCGVSSSGIAKIVPFLDLPLLFFPFMKKTFYFQSDLVAPKSYNSKRYAFSCGVAAHRFIAAMSRKRNASKKGRVCAQAQISSLIVAGECHQTCGPDLIWALSQPRGNYLLRLAAFVVIKILRIVCSAVTVDVASFRNASKIMKNSNNQVHLVLAPTHRSFFDFVLLSFIIFSLPELQIEIPVIVAANDFQRLPLIGWLARLLGAFYVRRGIGFEDCELTTRIQKMKESSQMKNHGCFEVFLEGKRSRDRRFVEPKTGFLKSLKQSGGDHAVIPIAINYESIPEHKEFVWETTGNDSTGLSTIGFLSWLKAVVLGRVFVGKIHVAAANPLQMKCESSNDFKAFGKQVQRLQREMILVSDYHVIAAARFFDIDHMSMKGALNDLGCRVWPTTVEPSRLSQTLPVPTDMSTLFSILMQCGPQLAPLFFSNRRQWSHWLDHAVQSGIELSGKCEAIRRIYEVLLDNFDYADSVVIEATKNLKEQGFSHPKQGHILQVAIMLNKRVLPQIIRAAVTIQFPERTRNHPCHSTTVTPDDLNLCDSSEKLGYWGFNDSGFAATSDDGGQRTVFMQGNRYSLSGKTMPALIPFIESEMKVKIDMMREFQTCQSVRDDFRPSFLDDSGTVLLSANFKRVSFSTIDRMRHGTGHSQEDVFGIREGCAFRIPDAVVWPASEQQVQKLVHMAKEKKWCLIPYGGGTNVTCATRCPEETVETRPIISVDMKLMCRIIWVNGEDGVAKIEAGITGRQLVQELHLRGYTMGHEPDSIEFSTLGGWIATKASGMKRNKYGNIEDIVKDVSVVSNDLIWEGRRREDEKVVSGRRSEGMELLSLMLGSEGCLGIITSAVVRVWPLPEVREFDSILFPTFKDGLSFTRAVARLGGNAPSSVRLLDNAHFRLGQALRPGGSSITGQLIKLIYQFFLARSNKFDADSVVCATITYEGSRNEVDGQKCTIQQIARNYDGTHLGEGVGKSGYDLTFMIAYLRDFALTYHILGESFETFVPWSKIDGLIEATKRRISEEHQSRLLPGIPFVGCRVTQLYHEGACLYFYLCISIDGVENGSEIFTELETAAREEILKHGGSLSHHHGIGKIRAPFQRGKTNLCEAVKKGIDKDNIFGAQNGLYAGISFSK